jgi:hypothetical protein
MRSATVSPAETRITAALEPALDEVRQHCPLLMPVILEGIDTVGAARFQPVGQTPQKPNQDSGSHRVKHFLSAFPCGHRPGFPQYSEMPGHNGKINGTT